MQLSRLQAVRGLESIPANGAVHAEDVVPTYRLFLAIRTLHRVESTGRWQAPGERHWQVWSC